MIYEVIMKFKTGDLLPRVRDMEDRVNDIMHSFGFSEKMFLQSEAPIVEITSDRALTYEELRDLQKLINENMPNMECTDIRLKLSQFPSLKDLVNE